MATEEKALDGPANLVERLGEKLLTEDLAEADLRAARAAGLVAASSVTAGKVSPEALLDMADLFAEYVLTGTTTFPEIRGEVDVPVRPVDHRKARAHFESRRLERRNRRLARATGLDDDGDEE